MHDKASRFTNELDLTQPSVNHTRILFVITLIGCHTMLLRPTARVDDEE